jgi:hypothetical protein
MMLFYLIWNWINNSVNEFVWIYEIESIAQVNEICLESINLKFALVNHFIPKYQLNSPFIVSWFVCLVLICYYLSTTVCDLLFILKINCWSLCTIHIHVQLNVKYIALIHSHLNQHNTYALHCFGRHPADDLFWNKQQSNHGNKKPPKIEKFMKDAWAEKNRKSNNKKISWKHSLINSIHWKKIDFLQRTILRTINTNQI